MQSFLSIVIKLVKIGILGGNFIIFWTNLLEQQFFNPGPLEKRTRGDISGV